MQKKLQLLLFTRFPEAGKTKTRLIPVLGPDGAARLQILLTEKIAGETLLLSQQLDILITIHFCGGNREKMVKWLGPTFEYIRQSDGTIGTKMKKSMSTAFHNSAQAVILIGSDIPDISAEILAQGYSGLQNSEVIIGPSFDGGYYLIGCTADHTQQLLPLLFDKMSWSSPEVLPTTIARLDKAGFTYTLLPTLQDIDSPDDIAFAIRRGLI